MEQAITTYLSNPEVINKQVLKRLSIRLNEEQLSCTFENLETSDLLRIFTSCMQRDVNLRRQISSLETCKNLRSLYQKLYFLLANETSFNELFKRLQNTCKLTYQNNTDIRKLISFLLTLAWQEAFCMG
jgi:hypothetical protein